MCDFCEHMDWTKWDHLALSGTVSEIFASEDMNINASSVVYWHDLWSRYLFFEPHFAMLINWNNMYRNGFKLWHVTQMLFILILKFIFWAMLSGETGKKWKNQCPSHCSNNSGGPISRTEITGGHQGIWCSIGIQARWTVKLILYAEWLLWLRIVKGAITEPRVTGGQNLLM